MHIFDTHCHYNLEPFTQNWQERWNNAQAKGVKKSMVIGTDLQSSALALDYTTDANLYAAIGIHPSEFNTVTADVEAAISELRLLDRSKVSAIGETGLDYFRLEENDANTSIIKTTQQQALVAHISLAQDYQVPLILHVRDKTEEAYWDILEILKKENHAGVPFILHCVSGPLTYIQEAVAMGGYVSAAGNITYKNADHLRSLVSLVPADKLLIETDAPFLPPQEFRGKTCEPWMISLTAAFVRDQLDRDLDQIYENSLKVFSLS